VHNEDNSKNYKTGYHTYLTRCSQISSGKYRGKKLKHVFARGRRQDFQVFVNLTHAHSGAWRIPK